MFEETIKGSKYPSQQAKETLAIQMLDGLNSLHSLNILHRDIKPENFLISQQGIIRLCDLGFASAVSKSQSFKKSIKGTQTYFAPEVEKGFSRIQTDLYALGLVILELDNLSILQGQWMQQEDITEIYQGKGILSRLKDQINRKSNLFSIVEICLHQNYQQRKSAAELIQILLSKQSNKPNFMVYSIMLPDFVKEQAKIICQYNQKKQTNKNLPLLENEFVELFEKLFDNKDYNRSFQIIGTGCYGIVLATKNVKRLEDVVLKIQIVEDYQQIENEIKIMKQVQMSLIVELYNHYFIKGQNNKTYVVYEFERCSCSLKEYLEMQKIDGGEINENVKLQICHQIIGAVSYMHSFNIIHNDLKPDNFLVLIKDNEIAVKLCDFGLSIQLIGNQPFITEKSIGTLLFQAPEVVNNDKNKMYSKKSDTFSTGLILCLVDNYIILNEKYPLAFANMMNSQFTIPFDPKNQFFYKSDLLNRQSQIYKYIQAFVVLEIQKRKEFIEFINQNPTLYFQNKKEIERVLGQSQIQQNSFNDQTFQNKQKIFTQSEKAKLIDFINKSYENVIIISQEGSSLILGVFNKTKNRESVLKIQKVKSKSQIIRSISIMRTKMPLVVELYEYYYLTLTQKDDFIVYELEKCSCDLRSYLERQKSKGIQLLENQKLMIAQKMIDSINFLHKIDMIHNNIRLEKFLVQENKSDSSFSFLTIKLTDFNLAQCIRTDEEQDSNYFIIEVQCPVQSEYGMQKYRAPEQLRTHFSSKESDMFTLGICLCLLDNYDYLMPVYDNQCKQIQNQFKQPFSPLKNEQDLINRNSFIYLKAIKNILVYEAFSREDLSEILKDFKQDYYSQKNLNEQNICLKIDVKKITLNCILKMVFVKQNQNTSRNQILANAVMQEFNSWKCYGDYCMDNVQNLTKSLFSEFMVCIYNVSTNYLMWIKSFLNILNISKIKYPNKNSMMKTREPNYNCSWLNQRQIRYLQANSERIQFLIKQLGSLSQVQVSKQQLKIIEQQANQMIKPLSKILNLTVSYQIKEIETTAEKRILDIIRDDLPIMSTNQFTNFLFDVKAEISKLADNKNLMNQAVSSLKEQQLYQHDFKHSALNPIQEINLSRVFQLQEQNTSNLDLPLWFIENDHGFTQEIRQSKTGSSLKRAGIIQDQSLVHKNRTKKEHVKDQATLNLSQIQRQHIINAVQRIGKHGQHAVTEVKEIIQKQNYQNNLPSRNLLRGGGQCSCKEGTISDKDFQLAYQDVQVQEIGDSQNINGKFEKRFNAIVSKSKNQEQLAKIHKEGEQFKQIKDLISMLKEKIDVITTNTNVYRYYTIQIFNLSMMYFISGADNIDQEDNNQLIKLLDGLIKYLQNKIETFPCLDLEYMYSFFYNLNEVGFDSNDQKYQEIQLISKFIVQDMLGNIKPQTNYNFDQKYEITEEKGENLVSFLKEKAFNRDEQQMTHIWEIVERVREKFIFSKEIVVRQIGVLQIEKKESPLDELSFYIEKFIQLIQLSENSQISYTIKYIMIQISLILEIQILENQSEIQKKTYPDIKLKTNDQQYQTLIEILTQRFQSSRNFISFSMKDCYFRFLSNRILTLCYNLNFYKEELQIHLLYSYLTEKNQQIKVIFQTNKQFQYNFKKEMESSQRDKFIQKILQYQEKRTENLLKNQISKEDVKNQVDEIKDKEDLIFKISLSLIEKWVLEARQRLEADIANKDDILLEVQDLYIDQNIMFLSGKNIFDQSQVKKNALQLIEEQFLSSQNKNQQCKILGILAEGGTGKSMLIKKLETILINKQNNCEFQNEEKEQQKQNYIPFIIKCNNLDADDPSLDKYFEQQKLSNNEIQMLKEMERNKLILLDGYDEYSGDYFKIYEQLKLKEWKNTLFIISSRMEKISESDAQIYFSEYDDQGFKIDSSCCLVQLKEFEEKDILNYCDKFFDKQYSKELQNNDIVPDKLTTEINQESKVKFNNFVNKCLKNSQLKNLLSLPINLYLFTRLIVDKTEQEMEDLTKDLSDQIQIQEIFFEQQFKREANDFITQNKLNLRDSQLFKDICSSYFIYFQTIAIQMFLNKGSQPNFLQLKKTDVHFDLEQAQFKSLNKQLIPSLKVKIQSYVNSKIITRVKDQEIDQQEQMSVQKEQIVEFKHKSLFEYFAARAMKYDFDQHQEDIYKKDISVLSQFNINKKIIMSSLKNVSEQQILLKLYKLIKAGLDSENFKQSYSQQDISSTNRYIQYLKKSQISKTTEISQIDIGASNLLSALFISKFSYPKLAFKKCSFSQAYISSYSRKLTDFQDCNFENAFLEQQHKQYFETSNTKNAMLSAFQKYFDIDDIYQFNQVLIFRNTLVTITQSGIINQFEIGQSNSEFNKILLSNQITNAPLKSIHLVNSKNIFVIRAEKSIFEVDVETFEVINSFTFMHSINNLSIYKSKYIVTLSDDQIFYGDIQSGFIQLGPSQSQEINIYNLFQTIKNYKAESNIPPSQPDGGMFIAISANDNIQNMWSMEQAQNQFSFQGQANTNSTVAFSADGKFLAIASQDNTCKIWDVEQTQLLNTISSHTNFIESITFSADGKYLATGAKDNTCRIWNAEQGYQLVKTIQEHFLPIKSIAFSTDNKYLATGSEDNICKIWNLEKEYELLNTIQGHVDSILSVAFSPDNKYLATGSDDQTCKIWDIEKKQIVSSLQGHTGSIIQIAFSNDGKYLATCSKDKSCKIWNTTQTRFELVASVEGHTNWINSLAFSPDSKYLATVSKDNTCKVWEVDQGFQLKKSIDAHNNWINAVAFSIDSQYIVTGSKDNTCKLWDIQNDFSHIHTIEGHKSPIQSVAFSSDGKYLATGSSDYTCKIWNIEKKYELVYNIEAHKSPIKSVAFSADCKYLATGSQDNTCKIWNAEKQFEIINTIQGHSNIISSVAFSPNNKYIATASLDNTFKIWNMQIGFEYINIMQGHTSSVCSIAISPDSKYLATGSQDKTCKIWSTEKGFELIALLKGHTKLIKSVSFSKDGKYLATGSWDRTCKIWSIKQGFQLIHNIEGLAEDVQSVTFSPDCKYLATGSSDFICRIWNIENGFKLQKEIKGHSDKLRSVAFSPDGKYLATGSEDNTCKLWDVLNEFEFVSTIEGHKNSIASLAFSSNGKYLATGSYDNTCMIWNILNQFQLVKTIQGHTQFISSVSFSVGDKYLATASEDQTCKIWDVENGYELINTVLGHTLRVNTVAFSANGKYFATGSDDSTCALAGKWYTSKGLALTFTLQSFSSKIASSTSGIIYPQLYKKYNDLLSPLALGISLCIITFFTSWIIFYFDKNADQYASENNLQEQKQNKKNQFKFSDIKKFDSLFWLYAIQCPLMFGAFYAYENYLQTVLTKKFYVEKTLAGELVSIPYWIAFGVPLFGLMADKFGKRCIGLGVTSCFALISIFMILVAPQGENYPLICIAFAIFGIFLSSMCAYLYPTLPYLSQKQTLGTGFAICYSTKNGGLALMNFVCSYLMGSDNSGYNSFLLFFVINYSISVAISCLIYFIDRNKGSYINSKTPQLYAREVILKKEQQNVVKIDSTSVITYQ
ncbi:hypothetical protein ABPG74_006763 [Tetrahymena malaccensis]